MKRQRRTIKCGLLSCLLLLVLVSVSWSGKTMDHSLYGELLKKYAKEDVVDYQGLKAEDGKLDQYLTLLDETNPDQMFRDEKLALYINAYNAYTLKLIL